MAKKPERENLDLGGKTFKDETFEEPVNIDDLKSVSKSNRDKYKTVQMKKETYDRMKRAADREGIPYMGRLFHRILESWLDGKGY